MYQQKILFSQSPTVPVPLMQLAGAEALLIDTQSVGTTIVDSSETNKSIGLSIQNNEQCRHRGEAHERWLPPTCSSPNRSCCNNDKWPSLFIMASMWFLSQSPLFVQSMVDVLRSYLDGDGAGVLASEFRLSKQSIARHQGVPKDQSDLQTVSSFVYEFVSCIACEKCQMIS